MLDGRRFPFRACPASGRRANPPPNSSARPPSRGATAGNRPLTSFAEEDDAGDALVGAPRVRLSASSTTTTCTARNVHLSRCVAPTHAAETLAMINTPHIDCGNNERQTPALFTL